MKMEYVNRKEGVECAAAFTILYSNIPLVIKLFKTEGCQDDAECVLSVVLLFLSICLHFVILVLVVLLGKSEYKNEKERGNINNAGTDTERETSLTDIKARSNLNGSLNNAILIFSIIGLLLNYISNSISF